MKDLFTTEDVNLLLQNADTLKRARIYEGGTQRPFSVQKIVLALDTAALPTNPYKIGFPFRSLYVQDATDVYVSLDVQVGARDSLQSAFSIKKNDVWASDYPINECFLSWSAQTSKTITLILFTDAEFRSGSQISVTGGGVSINDGSAVTGPTRVALSAATAALIAPADTLRKKSTIQNKTGADLYVGDSTVTNSGATEGIKVPADGIIYWQNTAGLYGYSVAGGNVHRLEEK